MLEPGIKLKLELELELELELDVDIELVVVRGTFDTNGNKIFCVSNSSVEW